MSDELFPSGRGKPARWRPAVAPYRPGKPPRIRPWRPLPGQKLLPGLQYDNEPLPAPAAPHEVTAATSASEPADQRPDLGSRCPCCGATEFDEDGDCAVCLEPGVIDTGEVAE